MFDDKDKIIQEPADQAAQEPSALEQLEGPAEPKEEVVVAPAEPKPEEGFQRSNFKRLKEEKEKAERERDEMMRLLQNVNQNYPKSISSPPVEENNDVDVADDDLASGKHVQKLQKQIKKLESTLRGYQQETAASMVETRLKSHYNDFDSVVSSENISALKEAHPEIFQTLTEGTDLYAKGASAYKIIKQLGIAKAAPSPVYNDTKERVQANAAKPKSPSSIGAKSSHSALGHAGAFEKGLTPDIQKQLYEEMLAYRNQG